MIKIDTAKCMYCGGCTAVCPVSALVLKEVKLICDSEKCIGCGNCVKFCPVGALKNEL